MATPGCKMLLLVEPPTAFLKIVGRAAAEGARDFKAQVLRLHSEGISRFCLDLSGCVLMDSTFSGVLAGLASTQEGASESDKKCFSIVGANARVLDLLDNLGVLPLVHVVEADASVPDGHGAEIERGPVDRAENTVCCLEAHRLLMTLKPENAPKFQELTRMLESQIAAGTSVSSN
jgi:anti-anti-sigma regulatory factor